MLALIQHEVVEVNAWMTEAEFADIVATSQVTPGPVGINVATYAGYTAVINAGYDSWVAVLGAFVSSFSVILLPFIAMLIVSRYLMRHKDNPVVKTVLSFLKLAVVGLIAAGLGVLSVALYWIFCSRWGADGAAWAALIASVIWLCTGLTSVLFVLSRDAARKAAE